MAEIKRRFKSNCKEISVEHNGNSFLIICGKHINGGYCAFPGLNVATELCGYSDDSSYSYNSKKLIIAFKDKTEIDEAAIKAISKVITDTIQELPDVLPF